MIWAEAWDLADPMHMIKGSVSDPATRRGHDPARARPGRAEATRSSTARRNRL
jgi:hypothetical protein